VHLGNEGEKCKGRCIEIWDYYSLLISGQSLPIPRHSQTRAKNAGLVTLET